MDGGRDESGRTFSRRAALKAGGAGVASLGLAGCLGRTDHGLSVLNPNPPSDITRGGTFTIGVSDSPEGTNPLTVSADDSFDIVTLLNGFGTAVDPIDFGVHPSIFTKWNEYKTHTTNAKPEVRFNVRSGLTFSDGTACTVDDVLFTYRYLLEHRPDKYAPVLDPIESIEPLSSRWDLQMTLSKSVSMFDSVQLGIPVLPKHVWQDVDDPEDYHPAANGNHVGLGLARIRTYNPDDEIELAFRDDYPLTDLDWIRKKEGLLNGGPFLDGLKYRVYDSDDDLEDAFRHGDVDSIYGSFEADLIEPLPDDGKPDVLRGSDDSYTAFGFNLRRKPLNDLPFRQALGFAFDDRYWTQNLNDGHAVVGDFVVPPGYTAVRPEHQPSILPHPIRPANQKLRTGPSTQAFAFRETKSGSGKVDVDGVRTFLTSDSIITGNAGTFVSQDYPGSLTSIHAAQEEPKYDYTFESVESDVLKDADTDKEIRFDGNTITNGSDGPLVVFSRSADDKPKEAKMTERYVRTLRRIGIPVERQELSTVELRRRVYRREAFDVTPIDAPAVSEFAIESIYERFHSDNADDHTVAEVGGKKNTDVPLKNAMGYGLDDTATADTQIESGLEDMKAEGRNDKIRQATERIYLDFPIMVVSYDKLYWPVRPREFDGFVENVPAPGDTYLPTQLQQLYHA